MLLLSVLAIKCLWSPAPDMVCVWFVISSIAIEELAAHGHNVSCSTTGNHTHLVSRNLNISNGNVNDYAGSRDTIGNYDGTSTHSTSFSGNHTHIVNIGSAGGNQRHENRMPYIVVNRWKRTV